MRGAQAGETVTLTYDWWGEGAPPWVGHFLVSTGGSGYRILKARQTSRPLRYRYLCEKTTPSAIPSEARVFTLEWNGREWGSKKRDQLDVLSLLQELGTVEEVTDAQWAKLEEPKRPPAVVRKTRNVGPTLLVRDGDIVELAKQAHRQAGRCTFCLEIGQHTDWCVARERTADLVARLALLSPAV